MSLKGRGFVTADVKLSSGHSSARPAGRRASDALAAVEHRTLEDRVTGALTHLTTDLGNMLDICRP